MKSTRPKIILLFLTFTLFIQAQSEFDEIHLKNQSIIYGKVLEVSSSEITYTNEFENPSIIFKIEKAKVFKIEYANGKTQKFKSEKIINDPDFYDWQHKNALKVSVTSFANRHLDFYYERSLKPNRSFELGLGITGVGVKSDESYSEYDENDKQIINFLDANYGFSIRAGYKLKTGPDFHYNKLRQSHLLKGAYIKPEIVFSYFNLNTESISYYTGWPSEPVTTKTDVLSAAVLINFGNQWVFSNQFGIDLFLGFGYGLSNHQEKTMSHYAFMMPQELPLAINGGVCLAYLIK